MGFTKLSRYGNRLEVVRFSRELTPRKDRKVYLKQKRSESTFKENDSLWRVKRRIRRFVSIGAEMCGSPAFATFTYAEQQYVMSSAIEDWKLFTRRMSKKFPGVGFIRVPERHKKRGIHFHAVIFNLPVELPCFTRRGFGSWSNRWIHDCPEDRMCERKLRSLRAVWKLGNVDLQVVRKLDAIGPYLAGYLVKGEKDSTLFHHQLATANRVLHDKINSARQAGKYFEVSSYGIGQDAVNDLLERFLPGTEAGSFKRGKTFENKWLGHGYRDEHRLVDGFEPRVSDF